MILSIATLDQYYVQNKPEGRSNIARNTVRKNSEMRKGTCRHKGKEKEYKKKRYHRRTQAILSTIKG